MPKDKRKKKIERGKGKEEEEGEGIPLKQMNEYRRSNRMELLTKEKHDARKAVIRANNQKAEEALKLKGVQTQLDQTEHGAFKHSDLFKHAKLFEHAVIIRRKHCVRQRIRKDRRKEGILNVPETSNALPIWNTIRRKQRSKAREQRSKTRQVYNPTFQLIHFLLQVWTMDQTQIKPH
jgi:hypothetical protein